MLYVVELHDAGITVELGGDYEDKENFHGSLHLKSDLYLKNCSLPEEPSHLIKIFIEALLHILPLSEVTQDRAFSATHRGSGSVSLERCTLLHPCWPFDEWRRWFFFKGVLYLLFVAELGSLMIALSLINRCVCILAKKWDKCV